jgi:hypothetical protein
MTRTAHCTCGALRVEVSADPDVVGVCHCGECQRRTGSVFSVSALFKRENVRAERQSKIYVRDGQEGRKVRMHFCPTCGTTVFWEADLRPNHISVAVGAFPDPNFPPPRYRSGRNRSTSGLLSRMIWRICQRRGPPNLVLLAPVKPT